MNKITQAILIVIILICVGISGNILLNPSKSNNQNQSANNDDLAQIVDGKQVMKMTVHATRYSPNSFVVKAGTPVRWEITSSGEPSCITGAIISNLLPEGTLYVNPEAGQVTIKEFTPQKPGKYSFSCTMGMYRGTIEVIN